MQGFHLKPIGVYMQIRFLQTETGQKAPALGTRKIWPQKKLQILLFWHEGLVVIFLFLLVCGVIQSFAK